MIGTVRSIALQLRSARPARRSIRLGHRVWGFADQALTSGVSFVTTLIAATAMDTTRFGEFALALTAVYLVNTLHAGLITRPHNLIGAARPADLYRRYTTSIALTQLAFSVLCGVVGLAGTFVAAFAFPELAPLVAAATLAAICWQLQEFARRVLYTEERGRDAFLNDFISYGGQAAMIGLVVVGGWLTPINALIAIAATFAVGAVVGVFQLRASVGDRTEPGAVKETLAVGKWLAAAEGAHWTSTQIYMYIAAVMLGPVAAATIRATALLFGPLRIVLMFLYSVLPVSFSRRHAREGRAELDREVGRAYVTLVPILLLYCVPVALLAPAILRLLYQGRYEDAAPVVVITAAHYFFACLTPIVSSLLQVEGLTRHLFLVQMYLSVASIAVGWLLVQHVGVVGAVLGMTVGAVATNVYAFAVLARARRTARAS